MKTLFNAIVYFICIVSVSFSQDAFCPSNSKTCQTFRRDSQQICIRKLHCAEVLRPQTRFEDFNTPFRGQIPDGDVKYRSKSPEQRQIRMPYYSEFVRAKIWVFHVLYTFQGQFLLLPNKSLLGLFAKRSEGVRKVVNSEWFIIRYGFVFIVVT